MFIIFLCYSIYYIFDSLYIIRPIYQTRQPTCSAIRELNDKTIDGRGEGAHVAMTTAHGCVSSVAHLAKCSAVYNVLGERRLE